MLSRTVRAAQPWLITAAIVIATGFLKLSLNHLFNLDSPILLFFTAITLSAWIGGLRQGLFATALSASFVYAYFITSPTNVTSAHVWATRMLFFSVEGTAISLICAALRKSRDAVRKNERRFQRLFETNMIGLCISDWDTNVIEANDYFLTLLGVDRKTLEDGNLNWRKFTDPGSKDRSRQAAEELRATGFTKPFEKEYLRPDGTRVAALVAATRIDHEQILGFVLDLSTSRMAERLAHSEKFLESVIEFIPNMIFVKDAKDLKFVRFNRAGEELLGYPRSALLGKSDYDFFPREQAEFFVSKDRAVLENGVIVDIPEEPIATPSGTRFLHTKKIPLTDAEGHAEYLIGISEDITERKIAEQQKFALLQAEAAREEAEKVADRMALLSEQANEANRAKSAFLANISHELRTPLGAMLGFAELALEDRQKSEEYVRTVLRNGQELLRIVDEVLDLSKAESNSMKIESVRFSLPDLLKDIGELMTVRATQKGLALDFSADTGIPEWAVSDPYRLRQIILNVVGNAIKFTERGRVGVRTSIEGNRLKFTVTDTGIGISPAEADRLFRPFTQADDSTTRKFGGTGLGLFLSRNLARRMGGDVVLKQSGEGQGSQFEITVRITEARPDFARVPEERRESRPAPGHGNSKVLIVDDSEDNQDLIAAYLAQSKIKIARASRGNQAVELADDSFGLILMDIQMPEMDGFEALRRIRHKGVNAPIVAVTAHAMKGDRERCLEGGFDEYLSKPISKKALEDCLRRFL